VTAFYGSALGTVEGQTLDWETHFGVVLARRSLGERLGLRAKGRSTGREKSSLGSRERLSRSLGERFLGAGASRVRGTFGLRGSRIA